LWQGALSALAYEEPDSYVPGTLKADTVGFSLEDYGLQYIGMKQNMKIPDEITIESLRALYANASELERIIQDEAVRRGIPEMQGWMTGSAWLTMVTEEQLPKQVIKDVALAFGAGAIVIFLATLAPLYTLFVLYSMMCTIFLTMGVLYFTGWKIGTNEAIMISIASGFCADFIIQPMLALAHDYSSRSLYGKIQASLTTFCTPVSSALVTTLVAACFLYPCEILLFPPFATFLLGSGLFGIVQGFFVLPALVALISFNKRSVNPFVPDPRKRIGVKFPDDESHEGLLGTG
jgi:predicted RND superfamily exporter protein